MTTTNNQVRKLIISLVILCCLNIASVKPMIPAPASLTKDIEKLTKSLTVLKTKLINLAKTLAQVKQQLSREQENAPKQELIPHAANYPLANISSCWMNAPLQCLLKSKALAKELLNFDEKKTGEIVLAPYTNNIKNAFKALLEMNKIMNNPKDQHDKKNPDALFNINDYKSSGLEQAHTSFRTCLTLSPFNLVGDPYKDAFIDGFINILKILSPYSLKSKMDYFLPYYDKKSLKELPEISVMHENMDTNKTHKPEDYHFSLLLDYSELLADNAPEGEKKHTQYELFGIVICVDNFHYYSYAKDYDTKDTWFKFYDLNSDPEKKTSKDIAKISRGEVIVGGITFAKILFYQRKRD